MGGHVRPIRLDLAGFAVFREPTTVDFTDADFFALVGPTGSGKSTVLDAIVFALYGTVPRWGDRRAVSNALAPSATEARVRLVFESAGARYVLTRVVRRDGKGAVSTKHAGLEELPPGFNLASFDTQGPDPTTAANGDPAPELGAVLAGTPAEVDKAVAEVIGLPYEQFTKCVVLPQGEFAAFLHAKPAERQRILVNLLGLEVYTRIRERAAATATEAQAKATMAGSLLDALVDADDDAVDRAADRAATVAGLSASLDQVLPELDRAQADLAQATTALASVESGLTSFAQVRSPADAAQIAAAVVRARTEVTVAEAAVTAAEEREEKLRAELGTVGDPAVLTGQLARYAEVERQLAQEQRLHVVLSDTSTRHDLAVTALHTARTRAASAHGTLETAREEYQGAVAADRAAALRPHLRLGAPCPVCEHPVETLPQRPHQPAVARAQAAGQAAREAADAADAQVAACDDTARTLDLAMAGARAQLTQVRDNRVKLQASLVDVPDPTTLQARLETIASLQRSGSRATEQVRTARTAHRTAVGRADLAADRLRTAWRAFDRARDSLAAAGPPQVERDDLDMAWQTLASWIARSMADLRQARTSAVAQAQAARQRVADLALRIGDLFTAADVSPPAPGADPARVAAVAVERAESDHRGAMRRRADAERLRGERAGYELDGQVARTLASHLRADRFERWLLTEALDSLVDGASRILRELSADQYDLGHDRGEFFVIDHHDAGLRRAVRTLSGGETFQASLALALALSEQLAGLSTTASLESIMLDEGFGTLDASTMETVATTLENLAARGDRMVGVVTHVGTLAERIPVRFEVRRDARTARVERVGL